MKIKTHAQVCDVADPKALTDFLNQSRERLGAVDVLVPQSNSKRSRAQSRFKGSR